MKNYIYYLIFFILFEAIIVTSLNIQKETKVDTYKQSKINKLQDEYKIVQNNYKVITSILYQEVINQDDVLKILKDMSSSDKELQDRARVKLNNRLSTFYDRLKRHDFRQFHFHTKDGDSFLRFHKKKKYGDNLLDIRYSVKEVNRLKRAMYGFEEGRIYNGFRNVYPISYKNMHLGSVELSLPFKIFKKQLEVNFKQRYLFMIDKEIVDKKVFKEQRDKFYVDTFSKDYYFEKNLELKKKFFEPLSTPTILQKLKDKKEVVSTVNIADTDYIFVFLPIKNLQNKKKAYIVSYSKDSTIADYNNNFILQLVLLNLLAIVFIIFDILRKKSKESKFVKDIIDSQDNILIICDNKKIVDVNRAFLKFFKLDSLSDFSEEKHCLCKHLVKEDGFIYANSFQEMLSVLLDKSNRDNRIKVLDKSSGSEKIFMTKLSELSQESTYLLSLVDITMIQKEKDLLEYYTYTDPLTKLNNRKKLEEDIERLIDNSKDFSIVMVSVNGLNDINDKYGFVSGENLLIELASMIKKSTLDYGHLYRWESEEFFILSEKSFDTLLEGATSIKDNVARSIFVDVGKIDCSFAITTHRQGDTQKSIISRVDQGLCKSKDSKNLEII